MTKNMKKDVTKNLFSYLITLLKVKGDGFFSLFFEMYLKFKHRHYPGKQVEINA